MKSQSTIQMVLVLAVLGLGRDGWRSLIVTTITTEISTEYLHNIYIYRIFKMNSSFEFCIWLTDYVCSCGCGVPRQIWETYYSKNIWLNNKRTFCQAGNVGAWGYIIALMFKTNATLQFTVLPCAVFSNDSQRRFIVFKLIFSQMFTGPVICFANVENASERNDSSFPRLRRRRRTSRTLIAPDLNIFSWAVSECKSYQTLLSRLMQAPALARNKSEVILHIFPGLRTSYTSK